jgi:hypothetical protein
MAPPLDSIGSLDHDFFLAWQLLINDSLKKGQLLHWAHHFCGGIPGLANPQSGALSPYNLLGLYFGPVLQMKINLLIHFVICGCGFIFLCKRMKVSPYLGILGFLVWTGNGFVLFRILHGQQTFYPLLYLPLLFAFFWPYIDKVSVKNIQIRDIAGGSLLLIFMILEDGFQVLIYTYILLACISIYSIYKTKTLGSLVLISYWGIISVGLCLFRLLPVVELLSELPRTVQDRDFMTVAMIHRAFF